MMQLHTWPAAPWVPGTYTKADAAACSAFKGGGDRVDAQKHR